MIISCQVRCVTFRTGLCYGRTSEYQHVVRTDEKAAAKWNSPSELTDWFHIGQGTRQDRTFPLKLCMHTALLDVLKKAVVMGDIKC